MAARFRRAAGTFAGHAQRPGLRHDHPAVHRRRASAPVRDRALSTQAAPLAIAQIIARNIVPLAGIVFLGWSAQNVLIVYFADTMLTVGVIFAGVLRKFAPPIEDDGLAARLNGEAGMIGGGAFLMVAVAIPLGLPLLFMLGGSFDL